MKSLFVFISLLIFSITINAQGSCVGENPPGPPFKLTGVSNGTMFCDTVGLGVTFYRYGDAAPGMTMQLAMCPECADSVGYPGIWVNPDSIYWFVNGNNTTSGLAYIGPNNNDTFNIKVHGNLWTRLNNYTTNLGIGRDATQNSLGSSVVGIGYRASENSTGSVVVAIGDDAARNSTSSGLVSLGSNAATDNRGENSIGIGYEALKNIYSNGVTAIGYGIRTSDSIYHATALGYNARVFCDECMSLGDSANVLVGIGTAYPSNKLHVKGSFRLENGTQANNYVLTSDANGVGTWQAPIFSYSPWDTLDNKVIQKDITQYVGIGTSTPAYPFTVEFSSNDLQFGSHFRTNVTTNEIGNATGIQGTNEGAGNGALFKGDAQGTGIGAVIFGVSVEKEGLVLQGSADSDSADIKINVPSDGKVVMPNGLFGIGTASPTAPLHIVSSNSYFKMYNAGFDVNLEDDGNGSGILDFKFASTNKLYIDGGMSRIGGDNDVVGCYKSDLNSLLSGIYGPNGNSKVEFNGNDFTTKITDGANEYIVLNSDLRSIGIYTSNSDAPSGLHAIAIGLSAYADGENSIAINACSGNAVASGVGCMALGNVNADGTNSIAIGTGTSTGSASQGAIAMGSVGSANGEGSFSLNGESNGPLSVAIGYDTHAETNFSTAIGSNSSANADNTLAIGANATASSIGSVAIGNDVPTTAAGDYSAAMFGGYSAANYSVSIGYSCNTGGLHSYAFGYNNVTGAKFGSVFGSNTNIQTAYATAMGFNNKAWFANPTSWNASDILFQLGNGDTLGNPHNAMNIFKNGKTEFLSNAGVYLYNYDSTKVLSFLVDTESVIINSDDTIEINAPVKNLSLVNNFKYQDGNQSLGNIMMSDNDGNAVWQPNQSPIISTGTSAPVTTPDKVGNIFIDTASQKIYVAFDTTSSSDWVLIN